MSWKPRSDVLSLSSRFLDRRQTSVARQIRNSQKAIANAHSSQGTLRAPQFKQELASTYAQIFSEYAHGATEDIVGIVRVRRNAPRTLKSPNVS